MRNLIEIDYNIYIISDIWVTDFSVGIVLKNNLDNDRYLFFMPSCAILFVEKVFTKSIFYGFSSTINSK